MNILFMGTPDFAVPSLESLVRSKHKVQAVFTQPDKPKGRKMILTPPDVKVCAQKHGLSVYQPNTLKNEETARLIETLAPDMIVVVAYGKLLPGEIIRFPKYGCVNVHGSLLPKYRGAAPIQRSILEGEKETGVTTMLMDEGLDTGDMLLQYKTEILPDETSGELFDRLALAGAELLLETIDALENRSVTPRKQEESLSTYANRIDKSMCPIDFRRSAQSVHNQVRGLHPWPVASACIQNKKLKIHKTKVSAMRGTPGTVLSLKPFTVACKDYAVEILELQPEGKKKMHAQAFLAGNKIEIGQTFDLP